ncbi:MAG: HAD-IIIA family hydrolase [candidate division NC10 bacterium]
MAGGRGVRLRPLTDTVPKPMLPFHGRPFIDYLLNLLREQGFERILLLLGYLAEVVRTHVGNGRRLGLHVDYSIAPADTETGERVRLVTPLLDRHFLLLYCDNYWPMRMTEMWTSYAGGSVPAMVTVYANRDGYTRNNVCVDSEGYIVAYDRHRSGSGLNGVEIGYALLAREVVDLIPPGNVSFEASVYPHLAQRRLLRAFLTEHRYYSVGSRERFPLTEAFLAFPRAVILDRDGVLNRKPPKAEYVRSWAEFEWLPGAIEGVRLLKAAGYKVIIITNQAGIGRGVMTEADLLAIHSRMQAELSAASAAVDAIYYCPHAWDANCACRKPRPGLFFQTQREHHLDLTKTVFVGDDERDLEAGAAAGCPTFLVSAEFPLLECVRKHVPIEGRGGAVHD